MPSGMWLASYLGLWVLLLAISLLLVVVLRQLRELHDYWIAHDPEMGIPFGAPAPVLPTEDLYGRPVSLGAGRGKKTVLLFVSRNCKACEETMTGVPVLATHERLELVLVVRAKPLDTRLFLGGLRREINFPHVPVLADPQGELAEAYKVRMVPFNVVVDEDCRIGARGVGLLLEEISGLIRQSDELRQRRLSEEAEEDLLSAGIEDDEAVVSKPAAA